MLINGKEVDDDTNIEAAAPEPSLRDTIQAAFKESETKDAVTAALDANAPAGETVEQRAERARAANGQFAKDPNATIVDPKAITDPKAIPAANAQTTAGQQQQASSVPTPPRGWSPASKALFATLPPAIQADIHKRELDVDAGFAKYKGLDKHVQDFQAAGVTADQAVTAYRHAEQLLVKNFDEGIVGLCKQFNTHPLKLAESLINMFRKPGTQPVTVQGQQPQGQPQQQQTGLDPETKRYLQSLETRISKYETKEQQKEYKSVETDINSFLTDPAHIYADNVIDSMVDLIKQGRMTGNVRPLKEVYDAACWLNPEVRQILINEQIVAQSKGAIKKAKDATTQARSAAASVTGKPAGNTDSDPKNKTLRETIKEAYDASVGASV